MLIESGAIRPAHLSAREIPAGSDAVVSGGENGEPRGILGGITDPRKDNFLLLRLPQPTAGSWRHQPGDGCLRLFRTLLELR